MKSTSKPRPERPLSRPERAEVVSLVEQFGAAAASGQSDHRFGLHLAETEITRIFVSFHLCLPFESAAAFAKSFQNRLASAFGLPPSDEKIARAGQLVFEQLALRSQSSNLLALMRRLSLQDRAAAVEAAQLALLEKRSALAETAANTHPPSILTNEQKQAKIREFFDLEDLEPHS